MERMDMHSRNEYLKVIKDSYFKAKTRKEKTQLLGEYCRNTGQLRKYAIWKIHRLAVMLSVMLYDVLVPAQAGVMTNVALLTIADAGVAIKLKPSTNSRANTEYFFTFFSFYHISVALSPPESADQCPIHRKPFTLPRLTLPKIQNRPFEGRLRLYPYPVESP
ncbi:MAG: hypothetical protein ACOC6O_00840 [Chloroflexota bacterium]